MPIRVKGIAWDSSWPNKILSISNPVSSRQTPLISSSENLRQLSQLLSVPQAEGCEQRPVLRRHAEFDDCRGDCGAAAAAGV